MTSACLSTHDDSPDSICLTIGRGGYRRYRIKYRPSRDMVACCRLEQYHFTFCVSLQILSGRLTQRDRISLPKATFPFLIQCATRKDSYDTKRDNCSPVNKSHTMAVCPTS